MDVFEKNIEYPPFSEPECKQAILEMAAIPKLMSAIPMFMAQYLQAKRGMQLVVEKALSDELNEVDLQGFTHADLIIPAPSVELYFEDPALPTLLFYVKDQEFKDEAEKYLGFEYGLQEIGVFGLTYYLKNGQGYFCQMPKRKVDPWLAGESLPVIRDMLQTTPEEEARQRRFFLLVAKIFTYISIPQYKPLPLTRKMMHHGGKAGVKNRPKRPTFKVFLPPVRYDTRRPVHDEGTGHPVQAHRRRGHMRKLTSERYTQKKGQIIYVRPAMIHGGSLVDHLYVARKRGDNDATTTNTTTTPNANGSG